MTEYARAVPEGLRKGDVTVDAVAGDIAAAEGRWQDAILAYGKWNDESGICTHCGLYDQALAYERAGETDSAITTLLRFTTVPAVERGFGSTYTPAHGYERLGALYEQQGDHAKAVEYYSKFLDQWKDADPDLQPLVRDVKQRLARLVGETK